MYVSNATIQSREMPEGYTTNQTARSGFWIGNGKNNVTVHMDRCKILTDTVAFVLGSEFGEQNNKLYISNSTIGKNNKIRIDNNTHRIYIGKGCNFDISDVFIPDGNTQFNLTTAVFTTNEVYTKK